MLNALDLIADNDKIEEANQEVIKRMKEAHPYLIDIGQALDVIPGMHSKLILHSGPPITWDRIVQLMKVLEKFFVLVLTQQKLLNV